MAAMTSKFTESVVEEACLQYFGQLGYAYLPAPEIACDGLFAKRRAVLLPKLLSGEIRVNEAANLGKGCTNG